jgi:hypothetical protein
MFRLMRDYHVTACDAAYHGLALARGGTMLTATGATSPSSGRRRRPVARRLVAGLAPPAARLSAANKSVGSGPIRASIQM